MMNSPSSCLPPGRREPDFNGLPNSATYPSVPPFFRNRSLSDRWEMKPPLSQSRPYVSPDPSPLEENFHQPQPSYHHPRQQQDQNQNHQTGGSADGPMGLSRHPREFPYLPPRPSILIGRPPLPQNMMMKDNNNKNDEYFGNPSHPAPPPPRPPYGNSFWQHNHNQHQIQNPNMNSNGESDPWFNPIMLPQQNRPKKGNKSNAKKVEGKQPTFLTKLFGILDQPEYHHIIRWDETGEAIIIENPEELADKILPVVYRQSRFASFSRQLNIYGFNRKLSLRHVERGICDPDASTWSHPFLNKFSTKAEILSFKRRVPPRPTQAQKRRLSLQDEGLSPTSSEHSIEFQSPPDAYQHHLLPDVDEEKPVIFSHPRGSLLSQDIGHLPSFHAPPPDYFAYEQKSPTAFEFDYSNPEEQSRRFTMTIPQQRPFEVSRESFRVEPSTFFNIQRGNQHLVSGHDNVPQSAPANTTSFPIPIKVTQQHIRTRSVQGEPPSAMLYSPSSPYNTTSWLTGDVPEPQMQTYLKKEDSVSPTALSQATLDSYRSIDQEQQNYNPNENNSSWASRDFNNIAGGDFSLSPEETRRLGSSPQSLPTDFGSSHMLPQIQYRPPAPGQAMGYSNNISHNNNGMTLNTQSFSALSPDSQSPPTISPGVYHQSGFAFPSISSSVLKPEYELVSPSSSFQDETSTSLLRSSAGPAKSERRATISSYSPYSPRGKGSILSTTLGSGNHLRTISSRRGSPAPISGLGLKLEGGYKDDQENEALPSASIKFEDKHPFEGILGGEEISD